MKKTFWVGLLIAGIVVPAGARSEVKAGAGNISILGHIDFVMRYSADDDNEGWYGYESYNLEFAILGFAGQIGDNVDWVITEAFAFQGPYAALNTAAAAADNMAALAAPVATPQLLDARLNWHMGESLMLSFGRFIPPTSMTWNPHLLKFLGTVNYPLINGSGLASRHPAGGGAMIPLPLYQTGVMLTWKGGAASLEAGSFNGSEIVGGPDVSTLLAAPGIMNTMDIDKQKGTVVKASYDGEGSHVGVWYYAETASLAKDLSSPRTDKTEKTEKTMDASIVQWGIELAMQTENLLFQAQYLSTALDPLDHGMENLIQNGWYVLVGSNLGSNAQVVVRYDYVNYDQDHAIWKERRNEEAATTLGINYMLNPNATLGVDYTWRNIEDWDASTDELAIILEMNLF